MEFIIRQERARDVEQVRILLQAAFATDAESKLVDALRVNGKAVIALVAVCAEDLLGHILFSPVITSPSGEAIGIGLAPVAVLPGAQSQGMGSQLILTGLQLCRELGFEVAGNHDLENEYGAGEEFMVLRFTSLTVSGLVRYTSEFALYSV